MNQFEEFIQSVYWAKYEFEGRQNVISDETRVFMSQATYNAGVEYNKPLIDYPLTTICGITVSIANNITDFKCYIANP